MVHKCMSSICIIKAGVFVSEFVCAFKKINTLCSVLQVKFES